MKNNILIIAILLIIVGAGSFFAGMKYQQSKLLSRGGFRQSIPGTQRPTGTEAVRGEIISQDEKSITVKLQDNSSKIVLISENTAINKATEGSADDLKTGEQVMIFGQKNSDGSVSATNIQLGSGLRFGGPLQTN
jgi:formylmethanofuran:tetrahydromethanopterin formyltransferase